MKIYTEIVIDIETGQVLKEESFEYGGPIAYCGGGGTTVMAPEKSTAELEQIQIQNDLLKQQLKQSSDTTPLYMKALGMVKDSSGNWIEQTEEQKVAGMTPLEKAIYTEKMSDLGLDISGTKLTEDQLLAGMTDSEKLNYETTKLATNRYRQALSGTLPISPALESELASEQRQTEETLARKLGPDWQLSTPGQKAMASLTQKANLVREEARRGEISSGDVRFQNSVSNALNKTNVTSKDWEMELAQKQGLISNLENASSTSGARDTSSNLLSIYSKDRDLQTSVSMQSAANKGAASAGMMQLGGTVAGSAMVAAAIFA